MPKIEHLREEVWKANLGIYRYAGQSRRDGWPGDSGYHLKYRRQARGKSSSIGMYLYMLQAGDRVRIEVLRGSEQLDMQVPVMQRQHNIDRLTDLIDPDLVPLHTRIFRNRIEVIPNLTINRRLSISRRTQTGAFVRKP